MSREVVGELMAVLQIEDLTERQLEGAARNLERAARRMDQIDDPRLGVDTDRIAPDLDHMERRLRAVSDDDYTVTPEVDTSHIDDEADAGEGRLRNMVGGWTAAVVAAASAVGAAAGKELADQFMDWAERDAGADKLAAALGLNEWASARYGKLAGEIYARNFGDSVEEVNQGLFLAQSNGVIDFGDTDAEIATVVERALTLVDVFGQDLPTVLAAASTMVKTGLAHDIWEAFDIFTVGFQNGTNKADDLLDTLTEYPALWRSLGIDGQTALGLLNQGLEGGARNSDLVADALKEFTIRAKDGSAATSDALHLLGLDASDTADDIAAGGDRAHNALDKVLDRLRKTEDPVRRNAAAVGLFGTQAEDLQDALFRLDPSTAIDGLDKLAGAAERATETAGDNVAGSIEATKRKAKMAVEDYLGSLWTAFEDGGADKVSGILSDDLDKISDWWDENGDDVMDRWQEWWSKEGVPLIAGMFGQAAEMAWDAWWTTFDGSTEAISDKIVDWMTGVAEDVGAGAVDLWEDAFSPMGDAFVDVLNGMIDRWNDFDLKLPSFDGLEIGGQQVIPGWEGPALPTPNLEHLPHFARGGDVLGPKGSAVLAVVHGGEHVQTAEQKDDQDRYIRQLERENASLRSGHRPQRGNGNTTNIYTADPGKYMRDLPFTRAS